MKKSTTLSIIAILIILIITYPPKKHLANSLMITKPKIQIIDAVDIMAMKVLKLNNLVVEKAVAEKIRFDNAQANRINRLENRLDRILNMPIIVVHDTTYIKKELLPKGIIKVPVDTLIIK